MGWGVSSRNLQQNLFGEKSFAVDSALKPFNLSLFQICLLTRSASKTQGNSSPTTDYPPSLPPKPRRVSARSYTESFLLPNKTNVTSSTSTPTSPPLVTSSISNSFVPRYSVRQYHQVSYQT